MSEPTSLPTPDDIAVIAACLRHEATCARWDQMTEEFCTCRLPKARQAIARLRPASELPVGMDVEQLFATLKESGLEGLSHEDGWTLMETRTADALRADLARVTEEKAEDFARLRKALADAGDYLAERNAARLDLAACAEALRASDKPTAPPCKFDKDGICEAHYGGRVNMCLTVAGERLVMRRAALARFGGTP